MPAEITERKLRGPLSQFLHFVAGLVGRRGKEFLGVAHQEVQILCDAVGADAGSSHGMSG